MPEHFMLQAATGAHLTPLPGSRHCKGSNPCHQVNNCVTRLEGINEPLMLMLQPGVPVDLHEKPAQFDHQVCGLLGSQM